MYRFLLVYFCLWGVIGMGAQESPNTFQNPILSGFHPDPSVCRVGDDYYLVNSSFNWFPGIPIYQSKDLVNWKQVGHVLNRPSQLNMQTPKNSGGIWAPTIRFYNGVYYVVVTCKQCINDCNCGHNFYVTSTNPEGPYSDPIYIQDAPGIDPTIFWDDDGKVYYIGSTHEIGGPRRWPAEDRIYIAELDLPTGKLITEPIILTSGHAVNAKYAEGPHIYKIKGKYLLMLAEGGTWNDHAITAFVSEHVTGPYVALTANPVLSHRHFGKNATITTLGHADLVQTQNGDWWAVMLGCRPIDGAYYTGRETFLCPVTFEGYTPVFNPGKGQVLMEDVRPNLQWTPVESLVLDEFNKDKLDLQWNFLRTPDEKWYEINKGRLQLQVRKEKLADVCNPSLIARRIEHQNFVAETKFEVKLNAEEEAGMVLLQSCDFHYRFVLLKTNGQQKIRLIKRYKLNKANVDVREQIVSEADYEGRQIVLNVEMNEMSIKFFFGEDKDHLIQLGDVQDAHILTSKSAGGFIGAFIGMYTSSNGKESSNIVNFNFFRYKQIKK